MTTTVLSRTDTTISLEWDDVYGTIGDTVTAEGEDFVVASIDFRGPRESDGTFVTRAHAYTPLSLEREAAKKQAARLAGLQAATTDEY